MQRHVPNQRRCGSSVKANPHASGRANKQDRLSNTSKEAQDAFVCTNSLFTSESSMEDYIELMRAIQLKVENETTSLYSEEELVEYDSDDQYQDA